MINDKVELKINGNEYFARLDMGAISNVQEYLKKNNYKLTIPQIIQNINQENIIVVNEIIIQSILRCHKDLKREDILEDLKLYEYLNIINYSILIVNSALVNKDDKTEKKNQSSKMN